MGLACTALGVQLLEAMGSDTYGPGSMGEAERSAVDAVALCHLRSEARASWQAAICSLGSS